MFTISEDLDELPQNLVESGLHFLPGYIKNLRNTVVYLKSPGHDLLKIKNQINLIYFRYIILYARKLDQYTKG